MDLHAQLAQKKKAIVNRWFDRLMETYPADTAQFMRNQKDPFANPVGRNSYQSLIEIFDHIIDAFDRQTAQPLIDPIIRIRAIQNFSASDAVRFVFDLKSIVREAVSVDAGDRTAWQVLADLFARIDSLGLLSFDVYMQCREKIYDLKANEMRARTFSAFNRAGLIKEPDNEALS